MIFIKTSTLLVFCFLFSAQSFSASDPRDKGKDHPLIDRFPGTYIPYSYESQYDEFMVATGAIGPLKNKSQLPPVARYEGKIRTISYRANERDLSVLQIYRNYEKAFKKLELKETFSCSDDSGCGSKFVVQLYWYGDSKRHDITGFDAPNAHGERTQYRYWSGQGNINGKNYIVSLIVKRWGKFQVNVVLDINEVDILDTNQIAVSIDFKSLTAAIDAEGKVVLAGVLFDTNKTDLKVESNPVIEVLVEYLKSFPNKSFYVVGHTDSDGDYEFNINLSQGRANAVVSELVDTYAINRSRLVPLGIGPVSPVAKNNADTNKALNRRVEMVEM